MNNTAFLRGYKNELHKQAEVSKELHEKFKGHEWTNDGKSYKVPHLWEAMEGEETFRPNIEKLKWILKDKVWGKRVKKKGGGYEGTHTPEDVMKGRKPKSTAFDRERIGKADLSYPILVGDVDDKRMFVADGVHRLVRALEDKRTDELKAVKLTDELLKKVPVSKDFTKQAELKHIMITGAPGSGKSTMALDLEKELNMPVLEGDSLKPAEGEAYPGTDELREALKKLKKPHIVEGVQIMGLKEPELRGHDLRVLTPSRETLIERLRDRGWQASDGSHRKDRKGAEELTDRFLKRLKAFMTPPEDMKKEAEIKLDIDIGDVLLGGRFKNRREVVRKIDTDELGQPMINGKKLLNFRIEKKLPDSKKSKKTLEKENE
jgi:adenylate kinase family enzyme